MLSVIILTFNSREFIASCLNSLFAQDYQGLEVIVIDNGSNDRTVSFIEENYPRVRLIQNRENLGACKARNQGVAISKGEFILTLDCDVILEKDFLKKIMTFVVDSEKAVGMFQPKVLNTDNKTIYSCGIYLSGLRRFYDIGKGRHNNGRFNAVKRIFGACSAAALYRRECLKEIREDAGYFDERFFFLVEDVDLAWRAQRKGWTALYYPEAVCYHAGNSSGTPKKIRQYLCFRNRYYMLSKNQVLRFKIIHHLLSLPYDLPRFLYFLIKNKYALKAVREIAQSL